MKITRFLGTETTLEEKIEKIVGTKSLQSQNILNRICYNVGPIAANCFINAVDNTCLYDGKIYFLHNACGNSYVTTMEVVFLLESLMKAGKIKNDDIIAMKTQEDFDFFVKKYKILSYLQQTECVDNDDA